MSKNTVSLWPADFGEVSFMTPIGILRQQGEILGEITQNIVSGRLHTRGVSLNFVHDFSLFCPPLGYSVELLQVHHKVDFYPAEVVFAPEQGPAIVAIDSDDLKIKLREIFARPATKRIVASLLAQTRQ